MDCLKATPTALLSTPSTLDNLKFYEVDRVKHLKLSISDVIISFNLDEMVCNTRGISILQVQYQIVDIPISSLCIMQALKY